jgi:hypothetical protein
MKRNLETIKNFVGNGKMFTVTFIKKDLTTRKMNCRLGVTKHLKGGTLKYNPSEKNLICVYEISKNPKKAGYKMINVSTLIDLKANKQTIVFE